MLRTLFPFQHFCLISGRLEFSVDGSRQKFYVGKGFVKVPKGCYSNHRSVFFAGCFCNGNLCSNFALFSCRSLFQCQKPRTSFSRNSLLLWCLTQRRLVKLNLLHENKLLELWIMCGPRIMSHTNEMPNIEISFQFSSCSVPDTPRGSQSLLFVQFRFISLFIF